MHRLIARKRDVQIQKRPCADKLGIIKRRQINATTDILSGFIAGTGSRLLHRRRSFGRLGLCHHEHLVHDHNRYHIKYLFRRHSEQLDAPQHQLILRQIHMPLRRSQIQCIDQPGSDTPRRVRKESRLDSYLVSFFETDSLYVLGEPVRIFLDNLKKLVAVVLIYLDRQRQSDTVFL